MGWQHGKQASGSVAECSVSATPACMQGRPPPPTQLGSPPLAFLSPAHPPTCSCCSGGGHRYAPSPSCSTSVLGCSGHCSAARSVPAGMVRSTSVRLSVFHSNTMGQIRTWEASTDDASHSLTHVKSHTKPASITKASIMSNHAPAGNRASRLPSCQAATSRPGQHPVPARAAATQLPLPSSEAASAAADGAAEGAAAGSNAASAAAAAAAPSASAAASGPSLALRSGAPSAAAASPLAGRLSVPAATRLALTSAACCCTSCMLPRCCWSLSPPDALLTASPLATGASPLCSSGRGCSACCFEARGDCSACCCWSWCVCWCVSVC